ncbi:MAG: hypothetical protein LUI87_00510 [Lachnospiraceae bacterium]|nr:hypothetical protein [Lachnospiraceae bacterium]
MMDERTWLPGRMSKTANEAAERTERTKGTLKKTSFPKYRALGLVLTAAVCVVIIIVGMLSDRSSSCQIVDSEGNVLAAVSLESGIYEIDCEDADWAYADVAFHEAAELLSAQEQISEEAAQKRLVEKGAVIHTYLQEEMQESLAEAISQSWEAAAANSAGALCNLDGELLACYSHSSDPDGVNYVTWPTWAGSTMKPLAVYGPALEEDVICWSTLEEDSPYSEIAGEDGTVSGWPSNTSDYTGSMITMAQALKESNNAVAVKTLSKFGLENALEWLENRLGYTVDSERDILASGGTDEILDNLALGYLEAGVTVRQMLESYQVFAAGGVRRTLYAVDYIEAGKNIWQREAEEGIQIFSEETAYILNRMLKGVVEEGGTGEAAMLDGVDLCGKTGTSSDYQDNWFIGMTPQYVCAIWYSCENVELHTQNESVSICRQVMESLPDQEGLAFACPEGVEKLSYCVKSGLLAGEYCEETADGYYKTGTFTEVCDCQPVSE